MERRHFLDVTRGRRRGICRECELPESAKTCRFVMYYGRHVGNGPFCHFARVQNEVYFLVNHHERTANTTSDLRFSRLARVSLLEHLRYISLMMHNTLIARRPRYYPTHHPNSPLLRVMYIMMLRKCARLHVRFLPRLHKQLQVRGMSNQLKSQAACRA